MTLGELGENISKASNQLNNYIYNLEIDSFFGIVVLLVIAVVILWIFTDN